MRIHVWLISRPTRLCLLCWQYEYAYAYYYDHTGDYYVDNMCMITLFSASTCASWYDHMLNRMRVRIDNLMIIMMVICGFFCLVLSIWLGIRWRPGAYRYAYSSEYRTQGLVLSLQVARSLLWRRCAPRHRVRLKVEVSDWPEFMRKPVKRHYFDQTLR